MVECLLNELQTLETEGILKEYLLSSENTHKIKGRISLNRSIKSLWAHGHFHKAAINYYDFTVDNPFNQLIKHTIKYCIYELKKIDSKQSLIEKLIEFYTIFDVVKIDDDSDYDYEHEVYDAIKNDKIPILRKYYTNICEICRLIINQAGVSFDKNGSDLEMSSFTIDMANIYEKYLLKSIRLHRSIFTEDIVILDGNQQFPDLLEIQQ